MKKVVIDQETWGRLRQWKIAQAKRYTILNRLLAAEALARDATDFGLRGNAIGRARSLRRIEEKLAGTGVIKHGVSLTGRYPVALWAVLKPRDPVLFESDDPADMQDCIAVNYLAVGLLPEAKCVGEGLWSLAVPDHALGRLMQRRRETDPEQAIMAAHHAVLRLKHSVIQNTKEFLLRAGPGAFACSWHFNYDISMHEWQMRIQADTWLDEDQLFEDQIPLVGDGEPGDRLGDCWLAPAPFVRFEAEMCDDRVRAQATLWRHFNSNVVFSR